MEPRKAAADISDQEFRAAGHALVDAVADYFKSLPELPVAPQTELEDLRDRLGRGGLPAAGSDLHAITDGLVQLLTEESLHIGHPRFMGYINGSPSPVGPLAEMLASAIGPNLGGHVLSPIASEIEAQSVRWLAELIGYPTDCGGLLVSGGNMANMVGMMAGRRVKAGDDYRTKGHFEGKRMVMYVSDETHTWIQKAADLFGLGTDSVRWIGTDDQQRIDLDALESSIERDTESGLVPFMVVASAGTVSSGAVDPIREIRRICDSHDLWLHVDGAYGAPAACASDAPEDLRHLALADSLALDPHKWLYAPIEAGCTLVKNPQHMLDTFSYRPPYYMVKDDRNNYFEWGPQNSRGFRALKVWLDLRHRGLEGIRRDIDEDIRLTNELFRAVDAHPKLEANTCGLSVCTFRYRDSSGDLNELNRRIAEEIQAGGELFLSNAVLLDTFYLRTCITNFRTSMNDIEAIPEIVARVGDRLKG